VEIRARRRVASPSQRNVAVLAASLFGLALGEELWQAYLPAYLTSLGAGAIAVGLFGTLTSLLDGLYQYPGGWLADRLGRRRTLLMFTGCAAVGYAIYALAPRWPYLFVGLAAVMTWKAGAFPTTFAVIGDSLPRERRAMAFAVQSTLIRVPRVIGAPLGGLAIVTFGMTAGIRLAFTITIVIALAVLVVQYRGFRDVQPPQTGDARRSPRLVFAEMPTHLKQLLIADCLVRIGEGVAASFIVLFVLQVRHLTAADYGVLYAVQQAVSIAFYLPGGRLADAMGRTWMVVLTFIFFAAFPLAVGYATTYPYLIAAFVVGGLKEIGEPARKSLIVDLAPDATRASTVGVYYGIRNFLVVPGGVIGGVLWQQDPRLPLEVAAAVSFVGAIVFIVSQRTAGEKADQQAG
jgi:predicted MFS family arabinose efflux permease